MTDLLTVEQVAEMLHRSPATVRWWRVQGIGPPGFRVGKRVMYRREAIEQWLDQQEAQDTHHRQETP